MGNTLSLRWQNRSSTR